MPCHSKRYLDRLNQAKIDSVNWSAKFNSRRFLRYWHIFWWLAVFKKKLGFIYHLEKENINYLKWRLIAKSWQKDLVWRHLGQKNELEHKQLQEVFQINKRRKQTEIERKLIFEFIKKTANTK